jgi:hypothetical protein
VSSDHRFFLLKNQPTEKMDILEEEKRHDKYMKLIEHLEREKLPIAVKQCESCGGTIYGTDSNIQCADCGAQSTNYGGCFPGGPASDSWTADCKASKKIAKEWMK